MGGNSLDFVFFKDPDGRLKFRGDFEGLYRLDPDPWGQSGGHPRMGDYYAFSRRNLVAALGEVPWETALEVGCGIGYVTQMLDRAFPGRQVAGVDISPCAVERAREMFPGLEFFVGDFSAPALGAEFGRRFGVVILNHMLWYVLHRMPVVFENVLALLQPKGHLIVQNAFLEEQGYGREIVDGFNGLVKYVMDHHFADFQVIRAQYDTSVGRYLHHDGLLVLQSIR